VRRQTPSGKVPLAARAFLVALGRPHCVAFLNSAVCQCGAAPTGALLSSCLAHRGPERFFL